MDVIDAALFILLGHESVLRCRFSLIVIWSTERKMAISNEINTNIHLFHWNFGKFPIWLTEYCRIIILGHLFQVDSGHFSHTLLIRFRFFWNSQWHFTKRHFNNVREKNFKNLGLLSCSTFDSNWCLWSEIFSRFFQWTHPDCGGHSLFVHRFQWAFYTENSIISNIIYQMQNNGCI